jgi:hypothetical protein
MTQLTRRAILAGAAATTALSPLATVSSAHAAAPLAGKQTAGWYRYKVGDIEITVVTDGVNRFPLNDAFVTNVKRTTSTPHLPPPTWKRTRWRSHIRRLS